MESDSEEEESQYFRGIRESRQSDHRHNVTRGGQEVAWLNAGRGEMVGPGTSQEIFEGDSVTLSVHGKFLDKKKAFVNKASFATMGGKTALLDQLNEFAQNSKMAGGANPIAVLNLVDIVAKDLQKKESPEAYLMYALYDKDSNRYEVGKRVLTRNAANQHEELEEKLAIKKNGYIETFVVNETSQDVWFDNFKVLSQGSILVQETHYDPWGLELKGIGYEYAGVKRNKYLYNGKELIEDNGLHYYDYGARMYDPVIGRWGVVDPKVDKYAPVSPYNYALNNPILFIDPDGEEVKPTNEAAYKAILNTLTAEDAVYVQLDKNGMIDRGVINQRQSKSGNFQALQTLVNDNRITEVTVASKFNYKDENGKMQVGKSGVSYVNELEMMFEMYGGAFTKDQLKEMGFKDEVSRDGMVGITLLPGEDSPNGNVIVIIGEGQTDKDAAQIAAHETYGHAYFYIIGKDPNHGQDRNRDNQELENQIKERQKEAIKNYDKKRSN